VRDVALIAAARRVAHCEIAAYGTARTLAKEVGLSRAQPILDETLDEESRPTSCSRKSLLADSWRAASTRPRHTEPTEAGARPQRRARIARN
jgi:ferritin-like metal-binding protein YciE